MSEPGISVQGIVFIDTVGIGLIILILQLVRTHKLYVGYALIWLLSVVGLMTIVSFPPLLMLVTRAVGAMFPASALSLLAFMFIFLVLVFMSVKLSILSTRQTELMQTLALNELSTQEQKSQDEELADKHQKGKSPEEAVIGEG